MGATQVLAPVFVQVAVTFCLMVWMGKLRVDNIRHGTVRPGDIALGQQNWPARTTQIANAFHSQLELPVLFYLVSLLSLFTARASPTLVVLGWIFVVTRLLHALIHVTTNNVSRRFFLFFAGALILILMWVDYFFHLYFGGSTSLPPLDIEALDLPQSSQ